MSFGRSNVSHLNIVSSDSEETLTRRYSSDSGPFDTAATGTGESRWLEFLGGAPLLQLDARSLVVVSPHPDDETLGAGGLMRAAVLLGLPVTVVSVTDGEKARPSESDLSARRRAELGRALALLGTSANPIRNLRARIPDGAVAERERELQDLLASVCTSEDLLVAPFERDGHSDHEATARACISVARQLQARLISYPIWAWHQASPQSLADRSWVRFDLDANLRRCKARAVECFHSQLQAHPDGPIVPPHVRQYFTRSFEAFVI